MHADLGNHACQRRPPIKISQHPALKLASADKPLFDNDLGVVRLRDLDGLFELRGIDPRDVIAGLGVPIGPARLKCALLSYKVLQGAVIGAEARWPDEASVLAGGSAP